MAEDDKTKYGRLYPNDRVIVVQAPPVQVIQQKSHCLRNACLCVILLVLLVVFGPAIALVLGVLGLAVLCASCAV